MQERVSYSLLLLRIGVFLVMFMWTLDKFVRPEHAGAVYEEFYFISGLDHRLFLAIATVELAILVAFVLGVQKRWTYGAVLVFHGISTVSSYQQYLSPFDGPNLLFFAAWPMLAACFALYFLRDLDTKWVLGSR